MPACQLPNDPSFEHLRKEAKRLRKTENLTLAQAQFATARKYGFPSWTALKRHLIEIAPFVWNAPPWPDASKPIERFVHLACLTYSDWHRSNPAHAQQLLAEHPDVAGASIYTAAAAGNVAAVRAFVEADQTSINRKGGPLKWEPLLYACYSRMPDNGADRSSFEVARLLLANGADPNAGFLYDANYAFTALTGAFGDGEDGINQPPHPRAFELAPLLLEAGADPNDSQAIYNKHFRPDDEHLKLLLRYGAGREQDGPWLARQGDRRITPKTLLVQELCWAAEHGFLDRVRLLADHGVSIDAPSPRTGRTAFEEARRAGRDQVAQFLLERGAANRALEPAERFALDLVAGRLDAVRAQLEADPGTIARLGPYGRVELMHRVAAGGRRDAITLATQIGLDINGMMPGTGLDRAVLHSAAGWGGVDLVWLLINLGADPSLRDPTFHATPLGWAEHNAQGETAEVLRQFEQSPFETAVDAIVNGDAATLERLLREHPDLATARSMRPHRSTLLHYVSANGVEDFRQKTPANIVSIARMLLRTGADVNATSEAYGGGSTTLGLVATSVHPEAAGVQIALMETLLEHGASMEQPGQTGNQHSAIGGCLANGQGEAARFFAERGAPMNLEEAAGVGRLDVVKTFFDGHGALTPGVSTSQLEAGFMYACGYGHADVVSYLLDRGVSPDVRNNQAQTGLHWAMYGPHLDVVKRLLDAGASVNVRDAQGGTPLGWAVNGWAHASDPGEREGLYETCALLVRAGADVNWAWFDLNDRRMKTVEAVNADERMSRLLTAQRPAPPT